MKHYHSLNARITKVIKKDKRDISCRDYQWRRERLNRQGLRVELSLPPIDEDTDFLCVNLKLLEDEFKLKKLTRDMHRYKMPVPPVLHIAFAM